MKNFLRKTKTTIAAKSSLVWDKTKSIGRAFKREAHETRHASGILMKIVRKKEVTDEEKKYLKDQSGDIGKALVIIALKIVPGAFIGIIAMEKLVSKRGYTLFPQKQEMPGQVKSGEADQATLSDAKEEDTNKGSGV